MSGEQASDDDLLEAFDQAAQRHGWEQDQGSRDGSAKAEKAWSDARDILRNRMRELRAAADRVEHAIHADREAVHTKFDALLRGLHHLITRDTDMSKAHDDLLALAKDTDSQADALIAAKNSGDDKLDDITAVVTGTRDKLAAAVKVDSDDDGDAGSSGAGQNGSANGASGSSLLTVSAAAVSGATSLDVQNASGSTDLTTLIGSALQGNGITSGTTVTGVAPDGSLTLSQPTTAAFKGDGSETLTIVPATPQSGAQAATQIDPATGKPISG